MTVHPRKLVVDCNGAVGLIGLLPCRGNDSLLLADGLELVNSAAAVFDDVKIVL